MITKRKILAAGFAAFACIVISYATVTSANAKTICKPAVPEYGMFYVKKSKAKTSAIGRWEKKVAIKHGIGSSFWKNAKKRSNICKQQPNGTFRCLAIGTPCKTVKVCKPLLVKKGMYYHNKAKAKASARGRWEKQAAIQHGIGSSFWKNAKQKKMACKQQPNNSWRCTAIAKPCS